MNLLCDEVLTMDFETLSESAVWLKYAINNNLPIYWGDACLEKWRTVFNEKIQLYEWYFWPKEVVVETYKLIWMCTDTFKKEYSCECTTNEGGFDYVKIEEIEDTNLVTTNEELAAVYIDPKNYCITCEKPLFSINILN